MNNESTFSIYYEDETNQGANIIPETCKAEEEVSKPQNPNRGSSSLLSLMIQ